MRRNTDIIKNIKRVSCRFDMDVPEERRAWQILNNAELLRIAAESGITAAQLCLKWSLEHGYIILPKTTSPERMRENFCSWQLNLDKDIMHLLDNLPFCGGLAIDSDEVNKFDEL